MIDDRRGGNRNADGQSRKQAVALSSDQRRKPGAKEEIAFAEAQAGHAQLPVRPCYEIEIGPDGGAGKFDAKHSDDVGEAYLLTKALASRSDPFLNTTLTWILDASRTRGGQIVDFHWEVTRVGPKFPLRIDPC